MKKIRFRLHKSNGGCIFEKETRDSPIFFFCLLVNGDKRGAMFFSSSLKALEQLSFLDTDKWVNILEKSRFDFTSVR